MTPTPTGRLIQTARGRDLVLTRSFRASIEDVWASVTESERTARWFGSWIGEAAPGKTVRVTMAFEEGAEPADLVIEACDPPHRLLVSMVDQSGSWLVELALTQRAGMTELVLTHHLDDMADPASTGPGWEYYLDNLVASREDAPLPPWDDYYPSQKAYYERAPDTSDLNTRL